MGKPFLMLAINNIEEVASSAKPFVAFIFSFKSEISVVLG